MGKTNEDVIGILLNARQTCQTVSMRNPRSALLERLGITAVIFDLDGVLIDSMPFHYEAYRRVLAQEGLRVERLDIYQREGLGTPEVLGSLSSEKRWELAPERIEELAGRRRVLFYQLYQHRVFAEVPELLEGLSAGGYRLAVVSGATQQSLNMCLDDRIDSGNARLRQWLPVVVSSTSVACGKPFPDPYLKAMEQMGVIASQVLVVENAPLGIAAARAAGSRCAALGTTLPLSYLEGADWILPDHAALLRLLWEKNGFG